jgi:hypothetical protein
MTTALSKQQQSDLRACEQVIERGLSTFVQVGKALAKIRDERLYKTTHKSFERYCQERWEFSRQRASQLILAAEQSTDVDTFENESQAREARHAEKHHPTVADDSDDDDQDASGGAEPVTSGPLAGTEPDPAGVSEDRIEWVIAGVNDLWLAYKLHFVDDAERFAFVAGLENWQARQ